MEIIQNEPTADIRRLPFLAVQASTNSLQIVNLGDIAAADTFTLTLNAQTTAAITFAADMSTAIVSALEALSNVAVGEVQVFKLSTGQVYAIGFGGTFVGTTVPLLSIGSPTTFTPGDVTGGVADSAITGLGAGWPTADIRVKKAGVAEAESVGTVEEGVDGVYDYILDVTEVDTLGPLYFTVRTFGVSVWPASAVVVEAGGAGETILRTSTLLGGASNYIDLDASASGTSNYYAGCVVYIASGTGAGQRAVYGYSYDGLLKRLYVDPEFITPPVAGSVAELKLAAPNAWMFTRSKFENANTFGDVSTPVDIGDEVLSRFAAEAGVDFLNLTDGVETGLTIRQTMRLIAAMAAGKLSGGGTTTVTLRNIADNKDRIIATVDTDGNRSAITLDLT